MIRLREFFWVLNALILFTLITWAFNLDLLISQFFFLPLAKMNGSSESWLGLRMPPMHLLYHTAKIPALALACISLAVLIGSRWQAQWHIWRRQAVFVLLMLLLGPWLLINVVLKDGLGKPSPSELIQFGGTYAYAQFWEEGTGKHNGAFPSGHAAVAFSLMLPYFFLRQQQPHASKCFLFLGLSWGLLIGVMRVSQGGHFFSDVIWSGAIIYLLGVSLAALFRFDQSPTRSTIPVFLKPPPFPHLGQSAITATLVKPGYEVATAQNSYLSSRQQALPHVNSFSDQG